MARWEGYLSSAAPLAQAIRGGLGWGTVGILASISTPTAFAQNPEDSEFDDSVIEEVIVTGSHIARAELDSASPVTVIDSDEIELTGMTDIGELLQRLPSMSGFQTNTTVNNDGNGSVRINLRGLGAHRTLVLINGRRVVSTDFQTIPATMIERIEVLKDGASAVYGADAVAGVVNIITRRDFEGLEVRAQYSDWTDSAGRQVLFSLLGGSEFERGNVVFGAEYVDQQEAYQSDTPWEFMQDTYYIYPEGCEHTVAEAWPQGCYPVGSSRIPEGRFLFPTQGFFIVGEPAAEPYQAGLMMRDDRRNYNYAPVNYLQTPYTKTNVFSEAHFDLSDDVRFNMEFRAGFRESAQELAPTPLTQGAYEGTYTIPETGETFSYVGISPDNYYLRQAIDRFNAAHGTDLAYEPAIRTSRRMIEYPRRYTQDVVTVQWLAGLEGDFRGYEWEVYFNGGRSNFQSVAPGTLAFPLMADALGPSADLDGDGQPECYEQVEEPSSLIPGCVPLNLFGGGSVVRETGEVLAQSVTQDMLDYIQVDSLYSSVYQMNQAGAMVRSEAWELPGGPLAWVAGYEYWKQDFSGKADSLRASGGATGAEIKSTNGRLTNNSIFVEILAPLWGNGSQEIYLKAGLRYDDWDAFDGDWTWQLGLEYQALESLKLRGTTGTVFRIPTIGNLYSGGGTFTPVVNDPCTVREGETLPPACEQPSPHGRGVQISATGGGNPNLQPETGKTLTAGVVWTPQFGDHGLTATADYWEVDLEDGIRNLGVQYILDDCYLRENPNACELVTRGQFYEIEDVRNVSLNVASFVVRGVDMGLKWDYFSAIGNWQASLLWTHMLERSGRAFPTDEEADWSGVFAGDGFPDDKALFSLQWSFNDLSVGWLAEYVGPLDAETYCNCDSDGDPSNNLPDGTYLQQIDSSIYHDLVATYDLPSFGLQLSAGVTNLTDEPPPFIESGYNASTDPSTYRLFGRGYHLRLSWKF